MLLLVISLFFRLSQDNSVSIMGRLHAGKSRNRSSVPERDNKVLFHPNIQNASGAHPL
jgi:hypothetical protein